MEIVVLDRQNPPRDKSRIWSALYQDIYGGCFHKQWGQRDGPMLDKSLIERFAQEQLETNKELRSLSFISPYSARTLGL